MNKKIKIAPSILSADFSRLAEEIKEVQKAGADIIHVDVMDGHFVPNITIGPLIVKSIRPVTKLPIDCHLMIKEPEKYIKAFADAGADWISIHIETSDPNIILPKIKNLGCRAGLVINPPTPIEKIFPYLKLADYVLVMTVNPGFGGQKYIDKCTDKIAQLNEHIENQKLNIEIEVDGGIKPENIEKPIKAGASIIVAGSAIFNSKNYFDSINELKKQSLS